MPNASAFQPRTTRPRRSKSTIAALERERDAWLAKLAPDSLFHPLFDCLPDVSFFAKDREGRTMFCSRAILERYRMRDASEMLGLTDFDLNPAAMAAGYISDDAQLLAGKIKRIERLELWFDPQGTPDWFVVIKLPILDRKGRAAGVMGVLRRAQEHEMQLPVFQSVARAVTILRSEYATAITIQRVAERCGQSLRQLQRRFHSAFGLSPQEFLLKTRVLAAMRLLEETELTASEIAGRCGFVDASSFADHFRRRTGLAPLAFRSRSRA